jgi:Na+/melibiose symporter-like transporter
MEYAPLPGTLTVYRPESHNPSDINSLWTPLRLRHLAQLAVSGLTKPEETLKEIAGNYAKRNMAAAKGFAATAASILTITVLPSFAKSQTNEDLTIVLICGGLIFFCSVCFFLLARRYATLYVAANYYFGRLYRLRTFLRPII